MSSEKLRKYLAYYQKVLKAEPENIEARLRLAAIFREMGKESHAVDEYVTSSKLLAKEGLPLEAIAACKAVLELEPNHSEIQYFLARLFAQVPEAMGTSSRVAQPLDGSMVRKALSTPMPDPEPPATITLREPKKAPDSSDSETTQSVDLQDEPVWDHEKPTSTGIVTPEEGLSEQTDPVVDEELDEDDVDTGVLEGDTSPLNGDEIPEFDTENNEVTVEMDPIEPVTLEDPTDAFEQGSRSDGAEHPTEVDRPAVSAERPADSDTVERSPTFETFEVNVFDMESLGLEDESSEIDFSFLEEFEGEVGEFAAEEVSETYPAVFKVSRDNLPEIPLLSQLPPDVFMQLLGVIDLQRVPAGTTILEPDHSSSTLYIVVHGEARVTREIDGEEVELARMKEGEFFGEFVLLTGRTGAATVRASTDLELLAIHETVISDIADEYPEIWDVLWDFYYVRMLNNLLASSDIFKPLDVHERNELARMFEMEEVVADEVFLSEGEPCCHLYLVLNGEVRVERRISGMVQELARMREGEFFGLASSLNDEPYLADLRAVRDTTLLLLPSEIFRQVTDRNPEVSDAVELAIMSRRELNDAFMSGITAYAELGVAKFDQ